MFCRKLSKVMHNWQAVGEQEQANLVVRTGRFFYIRPSVDGLCRDGPSEISRDPRTKRLQTQPKRLGWL